MQHIRERERDDDDEIRIREIITVDVLCIIYTQFFLYMIAPWYKVLNVLVFYYL